MVMSVFIKYQILLQLCIIVINFILIFSFYRIIVSVQNSAGGSALGLRGGMVTAGKITGYVELS
jgi:hypothetical protein